MVRSTKVGNLRYIVFIYDCTSIQALSCRPCQYLSRMSNPYHYSDLLSSNFNGPNFAYSATCLL
jgi:hypothetical protein